MHNCINSPKIISECAEELAYVLEYLKQIGLTIRSSIK
jgi:hypothetical protein